MDLSCASGHDGVINIRLYLLISPLTSKLGRTVNHYALALAGLDESCKEKRLLISCLVISVGLTATEILKRVILTNCILF